MNDAPFEAPHVEPLFAGPAPTRRRRRPVAVAAVVAVVLLCATVVAWRTRSSAAGGRYRTATASVRDVTATLDGVGTFEPVTQATVAFPVSGDVASVDVAVGDQVSVGEPLAELDTASLTATLHAKQAAAATASLNLTKALDGESVSPSGGAAGSGGYAKSSAATGTAATVTPATFSTSAGTGSTVVRTVATGPSGRGSSSTSGSPSAEQAKVLAAQKAVDQALQRSDQAQAAVDQVCRVLDSTEPPTSGPTSTTSTTSTTTPPTESLDACRTALAAQRDAQAQVAAAQRNLDAAAKALDASIKASTSASSSAPNAGAAGPGSSGTPAGSTPSGGRSSGTTPTSSAPSSAQLIAYQKAVDAADAAVTAAEQALAQATVVSPIAGTVAAVPIAAGDSVTAASSTEGIVVVGKGGFEATMLVAVADIPDVAVGEAATVVPDGSKRALHGKVVAIGLSGSTGTSGTVYPVTVGLPDTTATADLGNGATASVSITTKTADRALAVPTSSVSAAGTRHTVDVLANGKVTTQTVGVGAVGQRWIQITSGLTDGQVVVLADLDRPLPGSATASTSGNRANPFGAGSFRGAGGGPGGQFGRAGGGG